jgi:hypothetical protein
VSKSLLFYRFLYNGTADKLLIALYYVKVFVYDHYCCLGYIGSVP